MKKENEKRPMDNYHDDFIIYAKNRLMAYSGDLEDVTVEDIAFHSFHLLLNFDVRDAIKAIINVEEIMEEFENKFGDRYDKRCSSCGDKLKNNEDPDIEVILEDGDSEDNKKEDY